MVAVIVNATVGLYSSLAFKEGIIPKLRMWAHLSALVLNMVISSNLINLVTQ
jgi:hypothetical protein